ncbi:MAG: VOC family protein [Dehalococcoidia bacterium]
MSLSTRCAFGAVRQLGYVVEDLHAAAECWIRSFGAGPFFLIEGLAFPTWSWMGAPQSLKLDIMLGQYGNVMVELIRPHDRGPSVYAHCLGQAFNSTPHHYGFLVPSVDEAADGLGAGPPMSLGMTSAGSRFGYFDTRSSIGVLTELIEETAETRGLMALSADAALGWDGKDPVRRITL